MKKAGGFAGLFCFAGYGSQLAKRPPAFSFSSASE